MKIADAVALARGGRTVLVVPETREAGRALFETIDPATLVDVTHVRRSTGRELVKFTGGGEVRFTSAGSVRLGGARGHRADVVLVDSRALPDDRLTHELEPCVATTGGSLVVAPLG